MSRKITQDLKALVGKRVVFIYDRGIQVVGMLEELSPKAQLPKADYPVPISSWLYDHDYCWMSDVLILGPGGTLIEKCPGKFMLPFGNIFSVYELDDDDKSIVKAVTILHEVGKSRPEALISAYILVATDAAESVNEEEQSQKFGGWNAGLEDAKALCEEKGACSEYVKKWMGLFPDHATLKAHVKQGMYPAVQCYKHTLEHMLREGKPSKKLADVLGKMLETATHLASQARLNYQRT